GDQYGGRARRRQQLHSGRQTALPARTNDGEVAALLSGRARAHVGEVVAIHGAELHRVVAPAGDLRHAEDDGFLAHVEPGDAVARVPIGRYPRAGVLVGQAAAVPEGVLQRRVRHDAFEGPGLLDVRDAPARLRQMDPRVA